MIEYSTSREIDRQQFVDLLERSTLAERRPVDDVECVESMLSHANLMVTAWDGKSLVGVARSVTDFSFCCYLSDLAVDRACQGEGVGRRLMQVTRQQLGPRCKLILLAAPGAASYYPHVGFEQHPSAWVLHENQQII